MSLAALSKIVLEEFMNFSKHSIDRHYPMCRVMTVGGTGNDGHLTNIKKTRIFSKNYKFTTNIDFSSKIHGKQIEKPFNRTLIF